VRKGAGPTAGASSLSLATAAAHAMQCTAAKHVATTTTPPADTLSSHTPLRAGPKLSTCLCLLNNGLHSLTACFTEEERQQLPAGGCPPLVVTDDYMDSPDFCPTLRGGTARQEQTTCSRLSTEALSGVVACTLTLPGG